MKFTTGTVMKASKLKTVLASTLLAFTFLGSPLVWAAVPDAMQQMLDQKRYQTLLAQINQTLALKKTAAGDRYDLLMLKGEVLLRTNASGAAQDAFTAAALVGQDAAATSIAKATAALIKHSTANKYQPKIKASGSKGLAPAIDIVDATSRKSAFTAYLADVMVTLGPLATTAENATTLSPILSVAKQLADARAVETAGTGSDTQTKEAMAKLATHASDLIDAAIKPMQEQLSTITKDTEARQKKTGRRGTSVNFSPRATADANSLDSIVNSGGQVEAAAAQLEVIFADMGDIKTAQSDAEKLVTDASKLRQQYQR